MYCNYLHPSNRTHNKITTYMWIVSSTRGESERSFMQYSRTMNEFCPFPLKIPRNSIFNEMWAIYGRKCEKFHWNVEQNVRNFNNFKRKLQHNSWRSSINHSELKKKISFFPCTSQSNGQSSLLGGVQPLVIIGNMRVKFIVSKHIFDMFPSFG